MAPAVERGEMVSVDISDKSPFITVRWRQNLINKEADYFVGKFENVVRPDPDNCGKIFVQSHKLEKFKKLEKDGKITITNAFQYGQKTSEGDYRWIVYHDKEHKPYQHRVVKRTIRQFAQGGEDQLAGWGYSPGQQLGALEELIEADYGDYLHTF